MIATNLKTYFNFNEDSRKIFSYANKNLLKNEKVFAINQPKIKSKIYDPTGVKL